MSCNIFTYWKANNWKYIIILCRLLSKCLDHQLQHINRWWCHRYQKRDKTAWRRTKALWKHSHQRQTLSSFACGIRIGFEGNGVIRNILMTDNIIKVATVGIFLHSIHITSRMISGTPMENIIANNFIMNNVRMGLCVWHFPEFSTDMDKLRGYMHNVTFSNMHINACDYSFF